MPTAIDLLTELLAGPDLHGASCINHRDLFDATANKGAHGVYPRAIKNCAGCPVLAACRAWVVSLPRDQAPRRVVAGLIYRRGRFPA
jgi:WhiB family transcriptional regulator, redox-sensing transcriptional regulator